jgi:hypothetical protein
MLEVFDVYAAAFTWLLHVVTLGGVNSYYVSFSDDPESTMLVYPWLYNHSDVVAVTNGTHVLLDNSVIDFAIFCAALAMLISIPGTALISMVHTEWIAPKSEARAHGTPLVSSSQHANTLLRPCACAQSI